MRIHTADHLGRCLIKTDSADAFGVFSCLVLLSYLVCSVLTCRHRHTKELSVYLQMYRYRDGNDRDRANLSKHEVSSKEHKQANVIKYMRVFQNICSNMTMTAALPNRVDRCMRLFGVQIYMC